MCDAVHALCGLIAGQWASAVFSVSEAEIASGRLQQVQPLPNSLLRRGLLYGRPRQRRPNLQECCYGSN